MSRSWKLFLAAAAIAGVLLWVVVSRTNHSRQTAPDTETVGASVTDVNGGAGDDQRERTNHNKPLARLRTYLQGARTPVPRLAQTDPSNAAQQDAAAPTHHPRRLDPGHGKIQDKRPGVHPGSEQLKAELSQRMKQSEEAAQRCLDGWAAQDDSLDSGVMLAFSVDTQGLQEVWIKDRSGVPGGPLACIANSVYPIDWGGLTETPIEVSVRVHYTHDAGASDGSGSASSDGAR